MKLYSIRYSVTLASYYILLIGLCHKKKYYKYWGNVLPPSSYPPLPLESEHHFNAAPDHDPHSTLDRFYVFLSYSQSNPVITLLIDHVIVSCHCVMSSCHTHTHIYLQTRYEYQWIIYT